MSTLEASLVLAGIVIVIFFIMRFRDKGAARSVEAAKTLIEMTGDDSVRVLKRGPELSNYLSVKVYNQPYYKFNPATATYTGATVGGVTTGGWTVDEAHYSLERGSVTDRYNLWYKGKKQVAGKWEDDWHMLLSVTIPLEDVQAAKEAGLDKWLSGNRLELKNPISSTDQMQIDNVYDQYGENHDFYNTSNILSYYATKAMLDHDEMKKVYKFLCDQ